MKDKKLYIPTVNDYLLTGYNGTIQSVQYLMDKYCPELGETLDNIKAKKAEMISYFYENNRQIYIKNPEKGTIFDKILFDVPIDETNMNIFEKTEVAIDGVVSGFLKDVASGANAIVDMALSPLDTAEALTSPGALTLGTIWNGMTEDVVSDWQKETIQGKTEAIGRVISIISPTEILKAAGVVRKGVKAVGELGKTANVVDTAVDATKNLANTANTAVDLTKTLSNLGDMTEDAARGLNGLTSKFKNIKEKFIDDIISQKPKELLEQKPNGISEQRPKELLEQKPNGIPEQKPKELLEQKPNGTPEQKPNEVPAETVVRGKSGVNGSGNVDISGEKPDPNIDDIKTRETNNSTGNTEKPKETNTNNTSSSNVVDTNNAKPIIDIAEYSEHFEKLKALRESLPPKYQITDSFGKKIGNIAYSTSNINGYSIDPLKSFSSYGTQGKRGIKNPQPGWISQVENPEYLKDVLNVNPENIIDGKGAYLRKADTEYKIIENYNKILNHDYEVNGKIVIISEREVCPSCENVIKSFSKDYKNIELTIIDSEGKAYIVKNGKIN